MQKWEYLKVRIQRRSYEFGKKDKRRSLFIPSSGVDLDPEVNWYDLSDDSGYISGIVQSKLKGFWTTDIRAFNELGDLGWELAGITDDIVHHNWTETIFKRQKQEN